MLVHHTEMMAIDELFALLYLVIQLTINIY